MSTPTIHVVIQLRVLPEQREEALAMGRRYLVEFLREPGCLRVELYEDELDACALMALAEWEDQAALDAHFQMPYLAEFLQRGHPHLAAPPVVRTYRRLR